MKNSRLIKIYFFLILAFQANSLFASGLDLIYGRDDRYEVSDYNDNEFIEKARSVALRVPNRRLSLDSNDSQIVRFNTKTLGNLMPKLCSSEKYLDQYSLGDCSAFLVSENKLVTAGHCMMTQSDCKNFQWVFDFEKGATFLNRNNIYACKKIITQKYIYSNAEVSDYAVIELDRNVFDRSPLERRTSGIVHRGTPLLAIGHPLGVPKKIVDGGKVMSMNDIEREHPIRSFFLKTNYFTTNLDVYAGNSGSPVFNRRTGKVEGILIQGANDFETDYENKCQTSNKLPDNPRNSYEKVMRINRIEGID
jgi:V8-like Glu-specific endopeptidase